MVCNVNYAGLLQKLCRIVFFLPWNFVYFSMFYKANFIYCLKMLLTWGIISITKKEGHYDE